MVARSRSVADPRWSPAGTRLAWVDSFDGRSDLVVAPADGVGAAGRRHRRRGVGGGYVLGRRRRARRRRAATAGSSSIGADGGVRPGAAPRRPRARARRVGARRGRVRDRARRRVRHRDRARSTDRRGRCASRTPTTRGIRLVARRIAARLARVGPARHAVGRVAHRGARRRRCREGRRGRRRGRRRAAALLARRRPRSRSSATPTAGRSCGPPMPTAANAQPVLARRTSTRSRRGVRASVRTRGRPTARELAWCRNEDGFGRLVIGAPGTPLGARAVEGLAPRPRLGRATASCASGRAR